MKREDKERFVTGMKDRLQKAKAAYLVDYQGLDVEAMNRIRGELRKTGGEFQVVKNRLMKLACQDTGTEALEEHFVGPCALAIAYEDVIAPAKALVDQSKTSERLKLKVGQIAGKLIEAEGIKRLAELPSREVLLAQVLSAMQAVPSSMVRALHGILANLVYVLKAIESQKNEAGNG